MAIIVPDFLDNTVYPFAKFRQALADMNIQEGAVGNTAFKISQRAAGANMTVDIAAGSAWVQGDNNALQGIYHVVNDSVISGGATISAANASLPRLDQVVLRVRDSVAGDAANGGDILVLTGTATSGSTLANRSGAAALPNSCMRLADVLVPAGATSVVAANIRDRRSWARGAQAARIGTGAGDHVTGSQSYVSIDSAAYGLYLEFSGAPCTFNFDFQGRVGTAGLVLIAGMLIDGAELGRREVAPATANYVTPVNMIVNYSPAPGFHFVEPVLAVGGTGVGTIQNSGIAGTWPRFSITEHVRANVGTGTYNTGAVNV